MIIKEAELSGLARRSRTIINESERRGFSFITPSKEPTVFLSHKHEDTDEVKYVATILRAHHCDTIYIDWKDPQMQHATNRETAEILREKIRGHKKFILVVTADSVKSPWCNWELGYGDAVKGEDVALFCLEQQDNDWRDHEYLQLYPTIELREYNRFYDTTPGFIVVSRINGQKHVESLTDWLHKQ